MDVIHTFQNFGAFRIFDVASSKHFKFVHCLSLAGPN